MSKSENNDVADGRSTGAYLQKLGTHTTAYKEYLASLPEAKRRRIQASTRRISHGLHAVAPLTCLGPEKCPFLAQCPVPDRDKFGRAVETPVDQYPMGLQCVMESEYMAQKIGEYVIFLEVEPTNPVEMAMVNELALCDLLKNRIMMVVSSGDKQGDGRDLMKIDISGFSENGEPSTNSKIHPALEYLDRIEARRTKLLDKLMATRRAQLDLHIRMGGGKDGSAMIDEIKKLSAVIAQLQQQPQGMALDLRDETPILLDEK